MMTGHESIPSPLTKIEIVWQVFSAISKKDPHNKRGYTGKPVLHDFPEENILPKIRSKILLLIKQVSLHIEKNLSHKNNDDTESIKEFRKQIYLLNFHEEKIKEHSCLGTYLDPEFFISLQTLIIEVKQNLLKPQPKERVSVLETPKESSQSKKRETKALLKKSNSSIKGTDVERIHYELSQLKLQIANQGVRVKEVMNQGKMIRALFPRKEEETHEEGSYGYNFNSPSFRGNLARKIEYQVSNIHNANIRDAFTNFRNTEHRLEKVAHIKNVDFVNDSKSTNVHQAWFALESINEPVIWIMGGVDKGNDYTMLTKLVRQKVKYIITLGEDVNKIHKAFKHHVDMILQTNNMEEAVKMAYHFSSPGDCILLSPACASLDLFEDYQDRGRQFKEAVKTLS